MLKAIKYILKSALIGVTTILLFNLIGQYFGMQLPFNLLSIGLIGFFKLPGFLVLLIILIL